MARRPAAPPDPDRLFAILEPLLTAESVETLLEAAKRVLGSITQAHATAIFITDGASVVREAWQPEDDARRGALRPHFLALTHQSVKIGEPVALPFPASTAAGLEPRLFLLKARGRTLGAVCFACLPGKPADDARCWTTMEPIVRLLAQRITELLELSSWHLTRAQYERWFRQLDSHIRTLDRERQKFAAVVNQSDVYVFVADATSTIRWANRAIGGRFPAGASGSSWVGKHCRDLCVRFGGGECNGTCPVARALESNQTAHEEFKHESPDGDRSMYATALPIKGPEGKPQEVIVMLQDLSEIETVRKSETRYRALFEEQRRTQETLSRLETRLGAVIASSPIVLFSVDRDGVITLSEGRGLAVLGRAPGQVVGQSIYELNRDVPAIGESIRRALKGEELSVLIEVGRQSFDTHFAPLRDASGGITGVIGVATHLSIARPSDQRAA